MPAPHAPWSRQSDLGTQPMSDEHRRLVEVIDRLHEMNRSGSPRGSLHGVLDELVRAARSQFTQDETRMRSIGYPGLEARRALHRDLDQQLTEIVSACRLAPVPLPPAIFQFLGLWLTANIQRHDTHHDGPRSGSVGKAPRSDPPTRTLHPRSPGRLTSPYRSLSPRRG